MDKGMNAMGMDFFEEKKKYESTKEYVYRNIRKNIIWNYLKPGDLISETTMAENLSASRTPVREAIGILVGEELLEVYPQRGTYVSKIKVNRVNESCFMRRLLEVEVAKKACAKFANEELFLLESNVNQQKFCLENNKQEAVLDLDNQFHEIIFEKAGYVRIWQSIQGISADQDRIRCLKLQDKLQWNEVVDEHYEILQHIKEKDTKK